MPDYRAIARQAALKYLPAGLVDDFLRQIQQESGFNPNARSPAGAIGIAQFMPATARGFGINPLSPVQALYAAARYDKQGIDKYGSFARALSVYNSGKPDAYLDPNFAHGQTYDYVRRILGGEGIPAAPAGTVAATAADPRPAAAAAPNQPGIPAATAALLNRGNQLFGLPQFQFPTSGAAGALPSSTAAPGNLKVAVQNGAKVTGAAAGAISLAKQYLGTPYHWGGSSPKTGFDCSGLLQYAYAKQGINIPRTTYDQFKAGRPVARGQLRAGDAVFFEATKSGPGHTGIYLGNGTFLEAPHTGANVRISKLAGRSDYVGARRYV